jgi:hypothetical protein
MDYTQIIVAAIIAVLVAVYVVLKRRGNQPSMPNLPAVSEDVNLPAVKMPNPPAPAPMPPVEVPAPSDTNELENNGPQQ